MASQGRRQRGLELGPGLHPVSLHLQPGAPKLGHRELVVELGILQVQQLQGAGITVHGCPVSQSRRQAFSSGHAQARVRERERKNGAIGRLFGSMFHHVLPKMLRKAGRIAPAFTPMAVPEPEDAKPWSPDARHP
jgi:hypothetical protein